MRHIWKIAMIPMTVAVSVANSAAGLPAWLCFFWGMGVGFLCASMDIRRNDPWSRWRG